MGINQAVNNFLDARNRKYQHSSSLSSYLIKPIQVSGEATPLKIQNTPVEDYGKVYHSASVNEFIFHHSGTLFKRGEKVIDCFVYSV